MSKETFVEQYKKKKEQLEEQLEQERIQAQLTCSHEHVVEGKYEELEYVAHTIPPFRGCMNCGYAEEGWGCGYSLLKPNEEVNEIDRNKALAYVIGDIIRNEDHCDVKFGRRNLRDILK